ncbi:CHAPERONE PROTEIN DNAJ 49 [Salix purpurea]|uniref:CHAPERONE PROTEIN DNAJ 49 n=1 Tax=Salix purpurea TaxID=77065 RepID=A0A9Q0TXX4_SALPP|nr:CHAPERONE PROTEIN DNAJ 49 [Salix purpurea]
MDGNKDEAIRCVRIAEEAIASGNKQRAFKFIKMAQRLNHNLSVNHLLSACEKLDSSENSASAGQNDHKDRNANGFVKSDEGLSAERSYTEEHVHLIRHINRKKDYYGILGVEKSCSVEEIRKAYRKLSLKVHPDKNKAPGSEEAFKKLCKAFKCLSDGDSRMQYDQTGLADDARGSYDDDEFDPDEIFRAFFGQAEEGCSARHVCRCRGMDGQQRGEPDLIVLLQILPFLLLILLAYLPFL